MRQEPPSTAGHRRRRGCGCCGCPGCAVAFVLVLWTVTAVWHGFKPLPDGLRTTGPRVVLPAAGVTLLEDVAGVDGNGEPFHTAEIFDRVLARIAAARRLVLVDNFLFGPITGRSGPAHRQLCAELTDALIDARLRVPEMPVVLITDPINELYGGRPARHLQRLRAAGVTVVVTDLTRMRDSNALYSVWWRLGPRWLGNSGSSGRLPNPFSPTEPGASLRSWLGLLNFKANHRKVVLTDDGAGGWGVIVGSLNAHDGSSRHSNLALEVSSAALAQQVWQAEAAVMTMSGVPPPDVMPRTVEAAPEGGPVGARLLTEGAIRDSILGSLEQAGAGHSIDIAVFYLSHAPIIQSLVEAANRGAAIRIILDPSKDAFGRTKNGIPNRQAALALLSRSQNRIQLRWYDTHGEQFHPKAMILHGPKRTTAFVGSANFTRRNLDDLNLEADLQLDCPRGSALDQDFARWFDRLWSNDGMHATVVFERYEDRSVFRRIVAVVQERTGMGTF